jgi:hypothetical protein
MCVCVAQTYACICMCVCMYKHDTYILTHAHTHTHTHTHDMQDDRLFQELDSATIDGSINFDEFVSALKWHSGPIGDHQEAIYRKFLVYMRVRECVSELISLCYFLGM